MYHSFFNELLGLQHYNAPLASLPLLPLSLPPCIITRELLFSLTPPHYNIGIVVLSQPLHYNGGFVSLSPSAL